METCYGHGWSSALAGMVGIEDRLFLRMQVRLDDFGSQVHWVEEERERMPTRMRQSLTPSVRSVGDD